MTIFPRSGTTILPRSGATIFPRSGAICGLMALLVSPLPSAAPAPPHPGRTVLPCERVSLTASYLALVPEPGSSAAGPGFDFVLRNDTDQRHQAGRAGCRPARTGMPMWAPAGCGAPPARGGGSLVNALAERKGPCSPIPAATPAAKYLSVGPHQAYEWVRSVQSNPALVYQPGCARCRKSGRDPSTDWGCLRVCLPARYRASRDCWAAGCAPLRW